MTRIVLSFDDARYDEYDAIKLASSYGVKCTLNVATAYVERGELPDAGDCPAMTKEQVLELYKDPNVEIAGHSHTHCNDLDDIVKGQRILEGWLGTREKLGFASPHSQLDLTRNELQKFKDEDFLYVRLCFLHGPRFKYERYARKIARMFNLKYLFYWANKSTMNTLLTSNYLFHTIGVLKDVSFEQIRYCIDKAVANNQDCILTLHSICKPDHKLFNDLYSWDYDNFEKLCEYIKSLSDKGVVKPSLTKDLLK